MGAKKKIPLWEIGRGYNRYTIFDEDISIYEKNYYLKDALKDTSIEVITNKQYLYEKDKLEEKKEFINQDNYKLFIEDLMRLMEVVEIQPMINDKRVIQSTLSINGEYIDKNRVIENVNNLNWNVEEIEKYLNNIIIKESKENTLLSFLHMQNFTETILYYPYEREKSIYQKHTRHLVEIDFKKSEKEIINNILSLKDYVENNFKRNPYESNTKKDNFFNKLLNYGDFLFLRDCILLEYSMLDVVTEINVYRELEQQIQEKTTEKQMFCYKKKLQKDDTLITSSDIPIVITPHFI